MRQQSASPSISSRVFLLSLILASAAATACSGDGGGGGGGNGWVDPLEHEIDCGDAGGGIVEGIVLAPNGSTEVVGARVSIGACEITTGPDGRYRLTGVPASTAGGQSLRVRRGVFDQQSPVTVTAGTTTIADAELDATTVLMGVTFGSFDQVEEFLDELGIPWEEVPADDLDDGDLSAYDAIFLNCGLDTAAMNNPAALVAFATTNGGHVYASDWASDYVDAGWPGKVGYYLPTHKIGNAGEFRGDLVDPVLQGFVESDRLRVEFDLGAWAVIDTPQPEVEILMTGDVEIFDPETFEEVTLEDRPWMVRFATSSGGTLTYTAFHNHAQLDGDTHELLLQLVLGI
jgi:hypothetical protein